MGETGIKQRVLEEINIHVFCASLQNFAEVFEYEEPYGNVVLMGIVGLYKICFEQSWKAMKELLEFNGISGSQTGSPRQILKSAYQVGMIKDEDLWLDALVCRNNVAHAYNRVIAEDIVKQARERFYGMFCELKREMEENWIDY